VRFFRRLAATGVVLGAFACATPAVCAPETSRIDLRLHGGLLSGAVERAPIAAVVARVGQLSGAEVVAPVDDAEVTMTFSAVTPAYALEQVLRGRSYFLVLAADRRSLRRITVFGERPAVTRMMPVSEETEPDTETELLDATVTEGLEDMDPAVRMQLLASTRDLPLEDPRRAIVLSRLSRDADPAVRAPTLEVIRSSEQGDR
jgi:hypothetical protein